MTNVDYVYYLYGIKKANSNIMYNAFNFGLISEVGPNLNRSMLKISDIRDIEFEVACSKNRYVFVIRIPKMFLNPKVEDGKLKQIPVPIWQLDTDGNYILKSNLIHGMYDVKTLDYYPNEFYNEVFAPNGLMFDRQQDEYFKQNGLYRWINFNDYRNKRSFVELKRIGRSNNIWQPAITQYTRFYSGIIGRQLDKRICG